MPNRFSGTRRETLDRPAPNVSFTTDTLDGIGPPPDPEIEAIQQRDEANATAIYINLSERDRIDAEQYGVPLTTWKLMDDRQRQRVVSAYNERTQGDAGRIDRTYSIGELAGSESGIENQYTRAIRDLEQTPADARQFTILCCPVMNHPRWGRIHSTPGVVRVPRRQVAKKLMQGFTYYPEAGFMPEPTMVCDLCLAAGRDHDDDDYARRPFRGYPDQHDPRRSFDLEMHQKARHPEEWAARNRLTAQQGQTDQNEMLRQQSELIRQQSEMIRLLGDRLAPRDA